MKRNRFLLITLSLILAVCVFGFTALALTNNSEHNEPDIIPFDNTVTTDESEMVEVPDSLPEKYPTIHADPEEIITKDIIYDRMLNAVDYYDSVTVSMKYHFAANTIPGEEIVTIDSNLNTGKMHQTYIHTGAYDGACNWEVFADGEKIYDLNKITEVCSVCDLSPRNPEEMEALKGIERHYIGKEEHNLGQDCWILRGNPTHAPLASMCLLPQELAFGYLSDQSNWEISGETEYLGRIAVEIHGSLTGRYAEKMRSSDFELFVDKLTGIVVKLNTFNTNGDLVNYFTVTELAIDQPEITDTNLELILEEKPYENYVWNFE